MLLTRPLTSGDSSQWEEFISECPDATVFHTLDWQTILKEGLRDEVTAYWGLWSKNELIAIWPMSLISAFGGKILFSLHNSLLGYPIIRSKSDPSLLLHIIDYIRALKNRNAGARILHLSTDILSGSRLSQVIGAWGYDVRPSPRCTFFVDTSGDMDDVWKHLSKKARNAVRQARKHGLELKEAGESHLKEYFDVYKSTMRRRLAYRMGVDWQFFDTLYSQLSRSQRIKILLAQHEGVTIAGVVMLTLNRKGYWLQGASLSEYWQYRPNEFLLWGAYEWANRSGIRSISLGGAKVDNSDGLHLFKRHMGGQRVSLIRLTIPINRIRSSLARNVIRSYRMVESIVPDFVISALKPEVWFDE